jgi:hypothetical protein
MFGERLVCQQWRADTHVVYALMKANQAYFAMRTMARIPSGQLRSQNIWAKTVGCCFSFFTLDAPERPLSTRWCSGRRLRL